MKPTMKIFAILLLSVSITVVACGQIEKDTAVLNHKTKTDTHEQDEEITVKLGDQKLILQNEDGKCRLLFGEQKIDLDIPLNCDFHRLPDGKVRVFPRDFYGVRNKSTPKEYKGMQIVLIEYSEPVKDNSKDCNTELQAIKLVKNKIIKSIKMDNLAACRPFQWDAKNFTSLFE